ncbi:MAG TPA: hypothetical protein VJT49_29705 [Amycolatopsis sp.]|uniref:hypothetical protein n=1 Tax=Amycolatopsis sp. TaxID=37632 RepID=UPI002B484908|nr:hypothetical protein [Amycolatopsis sp.]HKS49212.1 hypothetical protein [Amycolatopsis sp.]
MGQVEITLTFDDEKLSSYEDSYLAALWHAVQASPAPHGGRPAGEVVELIGREIISRWLRGTPPQLWNHQGQAQSPPQFPVNGSQQSWPEAVGLPVEPAG